MKASTLRLREALETGMLTERDLANWIHESHALKGETLSACELANEVAMVKAAIIRGETQIPGFTWHHHQETGRMELTPRWVHDTVKHSGGNSICPINPEL